MARPEKSSLIQVRRSGVHGRGVYARVPIRKGQRIIEYTGKIISWDQANAEEPHDPENPHHTFYFGLENGREVIDAKRGGNEARWINHSCAPNCETNERNGRVFIHALRKLQAGEELFYDYSLQIDERRTKRLEREYACHCGARNCRGTMLEPK
jgi:uncharacterized protein